MKVLQRAIAIFKAIFKAKSSRADAAAADSASQLNKKKSQVKGLRLRFDVLVQMGFTNADLKKLERQGIVKIRHEAVVNRHTGHRKTVRVVEVLKDMRRAGRVVVPAPTVTNEEEARTS